MSEGITLSVAQIEHIIEVILLKMGVDADDAAIGAKALSAADARGVDTHGINRVEIYNKMLKTGKMVNANAKLTPISKTDSMALYDGQNGFGFIMAPKANQICIDMAKKSGIAIVSVRNSGHFGIAGYYAMEAVRQGMIGISMSNTPAVMVPFGGREKVMGNSPFCIAFPGGQEYTDQILVDMACSEVAFGKITMAMKEGKSVPIGWGVDREGVNSTDPEEIYLHGAGLPFGGPKGYCIAAVLELLTAGLTGGPYAPGIGTASYRSENPFPENVSHTFIVIDPQRFRTMSDIQQSTDEYVKLLKGSKPAKGKTEIFMPGELENKKYHTRQKEGVLLIKPVAEGILGVCKEHGLLDADATIESLAQV